MIISLLQLQSNLTVSTIGISGDVTRSGDTKGRVRWYDAEQCCVFGIHKSEYEEIEKMGKIYPEYFTYDAHRYV